MDPAFGLANGGGAKISEGLSICYCECSVSDIDDAGCEGDLQLGGVCFLMFTCRNYRC